VLFWYTEMRRRNFKDRLSMGRRNWTLFVIGLGVIVIGYIFLSIPPAEGLLSLTLAPILLFIGYCVLIPIAILIRADRENRGRETPEKKMRTGGEV